MVKNGIDAESALTLVFNLNVGAQFIVLLQEGFMISHKVQPVDAYRFAIIPPPAGERLLALWLIRGGLISIKNLS